MGIVKDLTGRKFGALTVIRREGLSDRNYANWLCKCDCGKTIITDSGRLRDGSVRDCGCRIARKTIKIPIYCKFNDGVECENHSRCNVCGWNPKVEARRKEKNHGAV